MEFRENHHRDQLDIQAQIYLLGKLCRPGGIFNGKLNAACFSN